MKRSAFSRRGFLQATAIALAAPTVLQAQQTTRNASGFVKMDWQEYFDDLGKGAIIADTRSRALHYWNADGNDYRVFPTSVPRTDELTKRGYTSIVRKKIGPSWTPTASQMERYPDWKPIGPGPDNPLGTHAMYLGWPAYIIHGTHDTRKIGRRSSDGCIGLYNPDIAELFDVAQIGVQVLLL